MVLYHLALVLFSSTIMSSSYSLFETTPYTPPEWAIHLNPIPIQVVRLSRLPTPVHPFKFTNRFQFWIKRDDLSSFELSGNKVRKLEFLLSDAISRGHDCIVTIGGIQSNHARATAVAARQLGLDSHLILRTPDTENDPGLIGNLLLNRMVGAKIQLVSSGTYARIGHHRLVQQVVNQLQQEGKNPYPIPVGGSNGLGTWGYLEAIREVIEQIREISLRVDHIVFACGSGGTATGIALGVRLAQLPMKVHAMAVCDSAQYFYSHMEAASREMGLDYDKYGPATDWCAIHPAQGVGYARSTPEELEFTLQVSRQTGVMLDPVYSGKALFYFNKLIENDPNIVKDGENVLFVHTGGVFGLYDKSTQLLPLMDRSDIQKMKIQLS